MPTLEERRSAIPAWLRVTAVAVVLALMAALAVAYFSGGIEAVTALSNISIIPLLILAGAITFLKSRH